jgi:hypothetical protein
VGKVGPLHCEELVLGETEGPEGDWRKRGRDHCLQESHTLTDSLFRIPTSTVGRTPSLRRERTPSLRREQLVVILHSVFVSRIGSPEGE